MPKLTTILLAALVVGGAVGAQDRIPVLLITGANNHDWEYTSNELEKILEGTGRFDVTSTADPASTLATEDLGRYRLFFLDYNGKRWGEAAEKRFLDAVRGGTGVVVMHAADNAFTGWKDYEALVGDCWRKGTGHGSFHPFDVVVKDLNHPITAGMPDMLAHPDELYHRLVHMHGAERRVLMSAYSDKKNGGTGREEPMALVLRFGKGRIFHTPLGHVWRNNEPSRASIADPQLKLLLARGAEWAATGKCTLEAREFGLELPLTHRSRPHDPWVFRCVLDRRPRMIVAALDRWMWVAYDAATCELYRVWSGGVNFEGSVYTGAHGPQPTTYGLPYPLPSRDRKTDRAPRWSLVDASRPGIVTETSRDRDYLGYEIVSGQLVVRSRLRRGRGAGEVIIEETPEHAAAGKPALERTFRVRGLKPHEVVQIPLPGVNSESRLAWTCGANVNRVDGKALSGLTVKRNLPGAPSFLRIGNGRSFLGFVLELAGETP